VTINDNRTIDGGGAGVFVSQLNNLIANTTYYIRAYASYDGGTVYGNEISFKTREGGLITDIDGNDYQVVRIGDLLWMAENLKVTHYQNGEAIPYVTNNTEWSGLAAGAYCYYNHTENYQSTYGLLYNWWAAKDGRNLAPLGWRVPSDADWKALEAEIGMIEADINLQNWRGTNEGGKLKEMSSSHWNQPNTGAINEYGFTALPNGYRLDTGSFQQLGNYTRYWTSSASNNSNGWYRALYSDSQQLGRSQVTKNQGYAIRCVKDWQ
jgi:uncharacterized protein (TIGR02145 family)